MTLDRLRPVADRVIAPFVAGALRVGLTPNGVSVLALLTAAAAAGAFAAARTDQRLFLLGSVLVVANGWLDLIDGALARELETTSRAGDVLDHVVDRYADLLVVAGLAAGVERYAVGFAAVTGVLMTSYLGTQAQAVDLDRVYAGVLGRADRLALVAAVTAVASVVEVTAYDLSLVAWLLVVLAVVGHLTAIQRLYGALSTLE